MSILRLGTQYGGGKTHSLVALVHTARAVAGVANAGSSVDPAILTAGEVRSSIGAPGAHQYSVSGGVAVLAADCGMKSAPAKPFPLSGVARRVLILTPKTVLLQWQNELCEKFNLNVAIYDGARLRWKDVPGRREPLERHVKRDGWQSERMVLMSSYLMRRAERQKGGARG